MEDTKSGLECDSEIDTESEDTDDSKSTASCKAMKKSKNRHKHNSDNWTLQEKQQLFNALADYGSGNLKLLSRHIPTKSTENVKEFLAVYKRTARRRLKYQDCISKKCYREPRRAPIDDWINYVTNLMKDNSYKSMLFARALKYIALFEPEIGLTNVRIRHCYEALSSCLEGEAPRYLNRESSAFLVESIQKVAREIRFTKNVDENVFLQGPKRRAGIRCYSGKKTKINEDAANLVIDHRNLNPLQVPGKLLYM